MNTMTLSTSTFLVAVGAVMRYAISAKHDGVNIPMIGAILMIVGVVGAIVSIVYYASSRTRRTVLVAAPATVVLEDRPLG